MSLSSGAQIGPYQIISTLGSGGMGDVYRARDPRLGRDVAIKSLPESLAASPERVARFQREAQILASLNHPHIGALYGLEEISGSRYLILELVEGDTLAHRLTGGALPLPEALTLARQIADALQAAHEKGIVHRDLKPANIALAPDGRVKVLDFGLAKNLEPSNPGDVSGSPTITGPVTRLGVVLGSAAYMSPEQARGLAVDKRTDTWAFGCVLYEMLAGRLAFPGQTISDAIAGVLEREPDWAMLPASMPSRIRWLLHRCLAKDPRQRLHDIADARIEIDEALSPRAGEADPAPTSVGGVGMKERIAWGVVTAVCLTGIVALLTIGRSGSVYRTSEDVRAYNTSIILPSGVRLSTGPPPSRFALSPDGRRLALVASDSSGRSMLYIRALDGRAAQPLGGTEDAAFPFWSPDSRFIAFLAQNKLKKVESTGGEVVTLSDVAFGTTGAWNRDDVILFTPKGNSPLFRVSAKSGTPTAVTTLVEESGDVQHSYPSFLPDGRHFLYFVVGSKWGRTVPRGVYLGSLDAKGPGKLILEGATNAQYANGHVVYLRAGALLAQPFDVNRLELGGQPQSLVEQVQTTGPSASEVTGAFTVSQTGVLAYQTASPVVSQLTWFDRKGTRLGTLGNPGDYIDVALSPDGSRVATSVMNPQGDRDIWTFEVARALGERFSFESGNDFAPNWSRPGADRLFFSSLRQGSIHLYEKPSRGSGSETLLREDDLGKFNAHSSPDGRFLIYVAGGGIIARSDIWVLPRFGEKKAFPFLETAFIESQPQFSPDGLWVAYMSNKSGRQEVYVTAFPGRESDTLVTTAGGSLPRWNRNGREIFTLVINWATPREPLEYRR